VDAAVIAEKQETDGLAQQAQRDFPEFSVPVRQSGARAGNWLTPEQARDLLAQPDLDTIEGKRDRAILAVLLGCARRRSELAALESRHIQQRDGRWVFVDLMGKGKRIRTVPIPPFVKVGIDAWTAAAGLSEGPLFRRVRRRKYPEKTQRL
jgi:integrase